jgi:hypothetical protein
MSLCSGIRADGGRCRAQAISNSEWCFNHHPDYEAQRKQRASKGGKRGGRGRPSSELTAIKARLSDLVDDVLSGAVDTAVGAVASQVLNVYLRAISLELKAREVEEFDARLTALEQLTQASSGASARNGRRTPWG